VIHSLRLHSFEYMYTINFLCTCTCHVDIDECEEDPEICGFNANCTNTMGNFTCNCLAGYEGRCVNCTDIDECLSNPCTSHSTCNNTLLILFVIVTKAMNGIELIVQVIVILFMLFTKKGTETLRLLNYREVLV